MRTIPFGRRGVYLAVALSALLFGTSLASIVRINHQGHDINVLTRSSAWVAHQLETELHRFILALERYRLGSDADSADEVRLRFDILWSRVPVMLSGRESEWLRENPDVGTTLEKLAADLEHADPVLQTLETADPDDLRAVISALEAYIPQVHRFIVDLNTGPQRLAAVQAIEDQRDHTTLALVALTSAVAILVLLMLLAVRYNRRIAEFEHELRTRAEDSNAAKMQFLATMSHELRTPLNAIMGFSDVIRLQVMGRIDNERYVEYGADIHRSASFLLDLISDLLDLSRIEAGRILLDNGPVDVVAALHSSVQMVDANRNAGAPIDVRAADVPRISADTRLVRQIFLNILSNAVKFTGRDGRITVSAGRTPEGGVYVSVEDTGVGIAEHDIDKVLEPFTQAEASMDRAEGGVGLGLSLAKSFAELHGGSLTLASEVGVGTTVSITFPAWRTIRDDASLNDNAA